MSNVLRMSAADYQARVQKGKTNKYHAKKKIVDGIGFDSTKEANCYSDLVLRQRAGEISELTTQVSFDLCVNGNFLCRYIADFTWMEGGKKVVCDAKGMKTPVYMLKKKLMKAVWSIDIKEL